MNPKNQISRTHAGLAAVPASTPPPVKSAPEPNTDRKTSAMKAKAVPPKEKYIYFRAAWTARWVSGWMTSGMVNSVSSS